MTASFPPEVAQVRQGLALLVLSSIPLSHLGEPSTASQSFKDIVSSFVFFALLSKKTQKKVQSLKMADACHALMQTITEVNGSAENIIFWTNYQNNLLAGDFRHLKLGFKYGTGMHAL